MSDDLLELPWRPAPENDGAVFAEASPPPVPLYVFVGQMESPEIAEETAALHNEALARRKAREAAGRRGVGVTGGMGRQFGDGNTQVNKF